MKHKTMRRLLYLVCAFAMALCLAFTACNKKEETPATVTATATFVGGTDATGTPPAPISVDAGTEITLPQNTFQKSGSAFDGWNDGAATYAEGAKYTLSKDTTFTALWKTSTPVPVTYTLTFALGDHAAADASVPAAQTLAAGASCNLPAAPKAAEGWQFDGWGSSKLAAGASYTMPASDTTLTAQWKSVEPDTPTPTTYTVTVSGEGFTVSGLNANYEAGASVSFTVTVTDTEKEIDTVTSSDVTVTKNADGSYSFTMPEKNVTVTVTLKDKTVTPPPAPTTYTVTVTAGQGFTVSGLNADGYEAGASVSFTVTVTDDSKEIDTVTSSDVTVNKNSDGSYGFTMPEKNVSVTVTLKDKTVTPVTYTLTFALGDHAAADATAPAAQTLAAGATYDLPDGPAAADGWQFDGWGSDKLAAGTSYTMPASDTTLTAQWKEVTATPVTEYTISYSYAAIYGQSTVEGNAPASPVSAKAGDSVTLPACGWTCLGYTFKGWSVQHLVNGEWKNIDDTLYQAEETFTMPDENVNLRASWSLASVTLKFDSNGGSGATDGFSFLFGVSFADRLSKVTPAFTLEGHAFAGWSYTADGEALDLTDADLFKLDAYKAYVKAENGSYTLTLYTVWGLGISYSYGYIPATETVQGSAPTSPVAADQGDEITFPACTWIRKGYTFAGWKVQRWIEDVVNYPETRGYWENITDDVYQPDATYIMPSESVQLLATWTKATVTLKFDANEGEGEIPSTTFNYGDSFTSKVKFLDNTFTYAGHRFVGWAYTPSGPAVDEYSYTWNACKDYVVEENGAFSLTLYAIWEIGSTPAPTTSFSDLCGVWVNGNSTIILSEQAADPANNIVGSIIVDGTKFYELYEWEGVYDDFDEQFHITGDSTSVTCKGITYTQKSSLPAASVTSADLEGKWVAGNSSINFTADGATYTANGDDHEGKWFCIGQYVVVYYEYNYLTYSLVLTVNGDKTELTQSVSRIFTKDTTTPEPEPAEATKYVYDLSYTYKTTGLFATTKEYHFTSVTLVTSELTTTAHIEVTVDSKDNSGDFGLDDVRRNIVYYTGEGTPKYYYTVNVGGVDFNLAVLENEDAVVVCDKDDKQIDNNKFLPEGTGPVTPTTYTVTVSGNGFTVSGLNADGYEAGASVSFTVTVTDDSKEIDTVTSSDVTVTKNADGSYSFTMPEKNVTVTVTLKDKQTAPATVTVTFWVDAEKTTQTVANGSTVSKPLSDPEDPNGTKTFRYWADDNGDEFDFGTPVTSDLDLYAYFRTCVTFDLNGGTGTQPEPVWEESGYYPRGIEVELPAADGYSNGDKALIGWNDGETTYKPGTTQSFTQSTKLTAVWGDASEALEYTIEYDYGYATGSTIEGSAPTSPVSAKAGTDFTFPECTWSATGYTFAGWKVQHFVDSPSPYLEGDWEDIDSTVHQPNTTYTMPEENIRLRATWTGKPVTIKFDKTDGTGTMDDLSFTYGSNNLWSTINGVACGFTYDGHIFVGWSYTAQGSVLSYSSDANWSKCKSYVSDVDGTYTLTLYAIWQEAPKATFEELCGVWTNGEHSLVLSTVGADSYSDIAGSVIVDGKKFYSVYQGINLFYDDSFELQITVDSATSISCGGINYTNKAELQNVTVTELEGTWKSTTNESITISATETKFMNTTSDEYTATLLCIDKYAVVSYEPVSYFPNVYVLSLNEAKDTLSGYKTITSGNTTTEAEFTKEAATEEPVGEATYTGDLETTQAAGFSGDATYHFTSITIDTSKEVTEAIITVSVDGAPAEPKTYTLSTALMSNYTGEGKETLKYLYTFQIGTSITNKATFCIAVLEGDIIVICDKEFNQIDNNRFTKAGA